MLNKHVDEIYHKLNDNEQQIHISLKRGSYDSYWKLRKDQALATHEISWSLKWVERPTPDSIKS